jgi:hypothetical protein
MLTFRVIGGKAPNGQEKYRGWMDEGRFPFMELGSAGNSANLTGVPWIYVEGMS